MSPDDNVLSVSASSGFSTADGYWLMLKPLSPGSHALHFASTLDGFSQNVTYDLTVNGSCRSQVVDRNRLFQDEHGPIQEREVTLSIKSRTRS
jgi:hypothetical protein